MERIGIAASLVLFTCVLAVQAQDSSIPEPKATVPQPIPAGVLITAVLKTDLSTKYSKVGEKVELEIAHAKDVRWPGPRGFLLSDHIRLLGRVTAVRRSAKGQTAALAIQVLEARSRSGTQSLDAILGGPVVIVTGDPSNPFPTGQTTISTAIGPTSEAVELDMDPLLGRVLSSKHDFFLLKNREKLVIVTR